MKIDPCAPLPPAIVQEQRKRVDEQLKHDLAVRLSATRKALVVMHEKRARILGDAPPEIAPDYRKLEAPPPPKPKRTRKPKTPTGVLGGPKAKATIGPNPLRMNNRKRREQKDKPE